MHKNPKEIARSLRAFRNAHKLRFIRGVRINAKGGACEAARSQKNVEYLGNVVPRLPLAQCTRAICKCEYEPVGSSELDRLNVNRKPSAKQVAKGGPLKRS